MLPPILSLPNDARKGNELPNLQHNSLINVPKLFDYGYTAIFRPEQGGVEVYQTDNVKVISTEEPVLRGWRDTNGLWCTSLSQEVADNAAADARNEGEIDVIRLPSEQINSLYHLPSVES